MRRAALGLCVIAATTSVSCRPEVNVAAAYSARHFQPPAAPRKQFERRVGLPIAEVSFWPLLESEPEVDFNLEEREPLPCRELANPCHLTPRTSTAAPFVYVRDRVAPARPGR